MHYWRNTRSFSLPSLLTPALLVALALSTAGCLDGDLDPPPPPAVGQVGGFVTAEPSDEYKGNSMPMPSADAGMAAADSGSAPAGDAGAPGGRDSVVEEAEIYRVHDDKLFYLNTYRGLLIFDIKDESKPVLLGRLPVYGYPIEMYFKGDSAFVLIKDALYLTQSKDTPPKFSRHNVSQLITVDVSERQNPRIVQRHDIAGLLREGLSRKVDDIIYVVSQKPSYYYDGWSYGGSAMGDESAHVYSYDMRDPMQVKEVDKLQLFSGGGESNWNKGDGSSRSFQGVSISATANALMVVERWQVYSSSSSGGWCSEWGNESVVRIVDISDYSGKIRQHTQFVRKGDVTDQFKQTYLYDPTTKKGTYLGIFSISGWNNCQREVKNELVAVDVTDGANPKELSSIAFGKPNETVRGSVFDVSRKVVFAITARAMDPLYAISFADLNNLKIESAIDGLSGDISVFRFIGADNKFLLAVGQDTSSECTGFGTGWSSTKMAVSVIDVEDLQDIRLVQRRCVAVDGNSSWQGSQITWDQDQAHKLLGMYSDATVNLITVPISYYQEWRGGNSSWDWWYTQKSAVGMMSWDLSKYDPLLAPPKQTVLQDLATVEHTSGDVKRTIFLRRDQADGSFKRLMLTLSETHLVVNDVTQPATPKLRASVEIAPYIAGVYTIGSSVVEHVRHGGSGYYYYGDKRPSSFRVKTPNAQGEVDGQPTVAEVTIGGVQTVLQHGDKLLLLRRKDSGDPWGGYYESKADLLVLDFSDPKAPKLAGKLELPGFVQSHYSGCGMYDHYYYGWGYTTRSFTSTQDGLVLVQRHYEWQSGSERQWSTVTVIDLTDAQKPRVAFGPKELSGWSWSGEVLRDGVDPHRFYLAVRQEVGDTKIHGLDWKLRRYFALPGRLEDGKVKWEAPINLPGRLVASYPDGARRMFLTRDYTYTLRPEGEREWCGSASCNYESHDRLHLLEASGQSQARLDDSKDLSGWRVETSLTDGRRLLLQARPEYDYRSSAEQDYRARLLLFDLGAQRFDAGAELTFETYSLQLLTAKDGNLLLSLPGDGILTLDVKDVQKPRGLRFIRTLGWLHNVAFAGQRAWVASGHFGTQLVALDQAAGTQL